MRARWIWSRSAWRGCARATVRPAQRTGYRPGQVLQLDWAEMPTRPKIAGRERRVYALIARCRSPGAQTAHFSFDMTTESFLEGHVRALEWLGGVPRECVYDNLRSVVARRDGDQSSGTRGSCSCAATTPSMRTACTPATPREKGSVEAAVRHLKTGFWPARRFASLVELDEQYADWRDRVCNRRLHATGRFWVDERLAVERDALRPLPPVAFDCAGRRSTRVPLDGYLKHGGSFYRAPERLVHQRVELRFDRDQVWIAHRGAEVARYPRSYEQRPLAAAAAAAPRAAGARAGDRARRARRSRRPSSPTTRSCAREQGEGRRAAALPAREARRRPACWSAWSRPRAGPRGGLALRAVPRDPARGRGLRPRRLRRPACASGTPASPR